MFECAHRDPNVPLEQTLGALAELGQEGKIGGVALSEVNADMIREAAKTTKIVAVEVEIVPLADRASDQRYRKGVCRVEDSYHRVG